MPTYEYHCPKCKATYDLRQGFDAETTHTCEECGKGIAKRVLHAPPVLFKGSGFYVTDSKGKGRVSDSATGTSSSSGDSSSDSSTDSSSSEPKSTDSKTTESKSSTKSSSKTASSASSTSDSSTAS